MAAKRQDANRAAPPRGLGASRLLAAALLLALTAGLVAMVVAIAAEIREPVDLRPVPYARSGSCQPCHPDHYDSWHRTFHRTMTQIASSASVLGDVDGASST